MNIEEVRKFLKKNFDGPEVIEALRFRIKTHLKDPTQDPLSSQVWAAYQKLPELIETPCSILDAGCMSGFLYHHLSRNLGDFQYVGVDRWKEALVVAKEFAPHIDFRLGDLESDYFGMFDYVICSNIPWQKADINKATENLKKQARKKLIFIHPGNRIDIIERAAGNTPDA